MSSEKGVDATGYEDHIGKTRNKGHLLNGLGIVGLVWCGDNGWELWVILPRDTAICDLVRANTYYLHVM